MSKAPSKSLTRRRLLTGLGFLAPNILGFLSFTVIPLALSLVLAFSNWDLKLHNIFRSDRIKAIGLDNFVRLISDGDFLRFLGNTLFFMMGIPLSIAGSLFLATLLSKDFSGGKHRVRGPLVISAVMAAGCIMLVLVGAGASAMTLLVGGLLGMLLVVGTASGSTLYRTLFYIPSFTSGVAVYILWKNLYNPTLGPINRSLSGPLRSLGSTVNGMNGAWFEGGLWLGAAIIVLLSFLAFRKLWRMRRDGELRGVASILPAAVLLLPSALGLRWLPHETWLTLAMITVVILFYWGIRVAAANRSAASKFASSSFGTAVLFCAAIVVLQMVVMGLSLAWHNLPRAAGAASGLEPPEWLTSYKWAKPAIMIMGFWAAIGSNNMLLYLAGLSNVPQQLYESADVDGATRWQKFWNITWPQLAPTTFFIVVMSVIGGLQGGFEMARTMTRGGPDGSTTTLAYFIYTEGFETGRLGFSSAVAWALFVLVFSVTMINWRFGNKYVND